MFNIKNILLKIRYEQEIKLIIPKLQFLLGEAEKGNSNKVDVTYWKYYLSRLEEIKCSGIDVKCSSKILSIKNIVDLYDYYLEKYNSYIKQYE